MRSDPGKGGSLRQSQAFEETTRRAARELDGDRWGKDSLSGNERNRLFFNQEGRQFADITLLSGADHVGDGRSVVLWDYNRDGKTDIASVNTNAPKLVLFRNEAATAGKNNFIALRLVGGNRSSRANSGFSSRDGFGARVTLNCGTRSFVEEHRCGEGYSAQNSNTLLIGVGKATVIDSAIIRWPGGKMQKLPGLPAGKLITVHENNTTAEGKPFTISPYIPDQGSPHTEPSPAIGTMPVFAPADAISDAPLRLFTLTATWCAACKSELPQLAGIRSHFPPERLAMFGLPGDENETPGQLKAYAEEYRPSYRMLTGITAGERKAMHDALGKSAGVLPASIVTSRSGKVLLVTRGLPTVSQIARILLKQGS